MEGINIVCLTETHEKYQRIDCPTNYRQITQRREVTDKKGGGLMVLYQQDIVIAEKVQLCVIDLLCLRIKIHGIVFILILV